jgi:hemerythrin-like domain-containing protein
MTEPMTMNRLIHGAVRRDLGRLSTGLSQMADGDRPRAQELQRAYANLQVQLTHHHEGEDAYVWPMLAKVGVDAGLLATMASEHAAMTQALAETEAAMTAVAGSGSAADAATASASLTHTQEVVGGHLDHEERDVDPLLAPYADSPEWKAVEKQLSRQPPGVAGPFFAWLTDGMSDADRAFLKTTVPTPVVAVVGKVFGRQYNKQIKPIWRNVS